MNLFVLASCNDYQVAIVDMDNDFDVSYVSLKDIPYEDQGEIKGKYKLNQVLVF